MRFFHANDLTISAAAQLSHPAHHRTGPFDLVFALHSVVTTLAGFYLAHALHLKPLAITNCLHGYLVFFITKYQSISGRDPICHLPSAVCYWLLIIGYFNRPARSHSPPATIF